MKTSKKLLTVALSAVLALGAFALVGCSGDPVETTTPAPTEEQKIDFSSYSKEQFMAEDFASKKISYQLVGLWDELPEYQNCFGFLYNLYEDGSLKVDQVNIYSGNVYSYYGFWEESTGAYGHEINADTMFMTDLQGGLMPKAISNTFYEEDGGSFADKFNFDIAPGMYTRQVEIKGGKNVAYATIEEYYAEIQVVVEVAKYVSKAPSAIGVSAVITVYSNNTLTADLTMDPHGVVNRQEGTRTLEYDGGAVKSVTLTFAHYTDGKKDNEDTVIQFSGDTFTWNANFMGNAMSFEMVAE